QARGDAVALGDGWDEDLHPRAEDGRFAPSGSGGTAEQTARGVYAAKHAKTGGHYEPGDHVEEPETPEHLRRGSAEGIYEAAPSGVATGSRGSQAVTTIDGMEYYAHDTA